MVEGESGILSICPPWDRPVYYPANRRVIWPNGAMATLYSADEPERLRGPQHAAWADQIGSWRYADAWDMLMFGLRVGRDPRAVVTTTPRPTKLIRELVADPNVAITRGSSYRNRANLAEAFFDQIVRKYEGTRLGRQELDAELLEDVDGALWNHRMLDEGRIRAAGIVVAGKDSAGSACDESPRTTKLYDRTKKRLTQDEVERIRL